MDTVHTEDGPLPPSSDAAKCRRRFCLRIYKNLLVLSVSLLAVFTAVFPIATIQSSLNREAGLGTASLSVQTAAAAVQALFLNALTMHRLGLKRAMLAGVVLEAVYVAANAYPRWYTLVPAAFVSGLGYALLRTAESTYVARLAALYADQLNLPLDTTKSRFFAIYYVFYCSARVLGNVASSLILGAGVDKFTLPTPDVAAAAVEGCGADYCDAGLAPGNASESQVDRDVRPVYYLCAFCLGCMLVAVVLMVAALDPLERFAARPVAPPRDGEITPQGWRDLLATARTWRNPKQLLLLPLCVYNGIDNAFWQADFTKSFVTCSYGIHWVGFVVAWYGLTAPIIVLVLALASKVICRPIPFVVAVAAHVGTAIALIGWTPSDGGLTILFVLSGVWGVGSGLLPVCLIAFHGILFEDNLEGAFSTYWLGDSIGATLSYAWSYSLCMSSKIDIVVGLVCVGFLGYLLTEMVVFVQNVRRATDADSALPPAT